MNEKDRSTSTKPRLVTAEAVRAGHPDKFCDQFADMLLDEHLKGDPGTRAAIEVMATDAKILVAGEVTSKASVDVEPVLKQLVREGGLHHGRAFHGRRAGAGGAPEPAIARYRAGRS